MPTKRRSAVGGRGRALRACLEVTEVGRLALVVIDGGAFAPRRVLELAKTVTDAVTATSAARRLEG